MSMSEFLKYSLQARGLLQDDGDSGDASDGSDGSDNGDGADSSQRLLNELNPEDNDELVEITDPAELAIKVADTAVDVARGEDKAEHQEIEQLYNRVLVLQDSILAVDMFGLTPTAVALGQISGLLQDTALYTLGCESFGVDAEASKRLGLESLASAGAEVSEKLGAKLFARASKWGDRLVSVLTSAHTRVSKWSWVAKPTKVASDFAKGSARYVKKTVDSNVDMVKGIKFSFKTAMSIAAAMKMIGSVISTAAKVLPREAAEAGVMMWFRSIRQSIAEIRWPFGKLEVRPEPNATNAKGMLGRLFCGGKPATSASKSAAGMTEKGGHTVSSSWTEQTFSSVKSAVMASISTVINAVKGIGKGLFKGLTNIPKLTASGFAATAKAVTTNKVAHSAAHAFGFMTAVSAVVGLLSSVVYFVVTGGADLIRNNLGDFVI